MRKNNRTAAFKLPNEFILDNSLTYSAKCVGSAIYSRCNCLGACRLSMKQIATMAQCTSVTALKAVQELERSGYITRRKRYGYDALQGRAVYQKSSFTVAAYDKFTFIPCSIFCRKLKKSSFSVYLYLRMCAGNGSRAFPSLNRICEALYASRSTVCLAVDELVRSGLVHHERCIKKNGAFCNNSYYIVCNAGRPAKRERPVFFRMKKVRHKRLAKPLKVQRRVCQEPFRGSIIRAPERKINTGG